MKYTCTELNLSFYKTVFFIWRATYWVDDAMKAYAYISYSNQEMSSYCFVLLNTQILLLTLLAWACSSFTNISLWYL
jgi:hypothetical protein